MIGSPFGHREHPLGGFLHCVHSLVHLPMTDHPRYPSLTVVLSSREAGSWVHGRGWGTSRYPCHVLDTFSEHCASLNNTTPKP